MKHARTLRIAVIHGLAMLSLVGRAEPTQSLLSRTYPGERLGVVAFAVSCNSPVREPFSRGVALLHDFWYTEAMPQFEAIEKADPDCAMAHWGIAMAEFHQIWDRPDEKALARGWQEMQAAQAHPAKTRREREYIAALADFYRSDERDYQTRINEYSTAMSMLYAHYPKDVDAGAFYALSLLAAESPDDTTLAQEHKAMAVLGPLFVGHPDHPGVVHYIIHACDTPTLAPRGLAAAEHYGQIAASGPHAVHMPGHIFARLGMWQEDIDANRASVAASIAAESRGMSGAMDQFHSDDFLLYAYLQSGQDDGAKQVMREADAALAHFEAMPNTADHYMTGMFPYYKTKYPTFFALETLRKGRHAYYADSTGSKIARSEMMAWAAFAEGNVPLAVKQMREAADLQDNVGQGEVDIPAREMLADISLESGQPKDAFQEYRQSLQQSPGRFNALFNAGRAAEASGDKPQAVRYYGELLKSTNDGVHSARPELEHAKTYVSEAKLAAQ
jgi:tetratricopeptide (TPR) repeat protein